MESFLHAFRDCKDIFGVWEALKPPFLDRSDPNCSIASWVKDNCTSLSNSTLASIPCPVVFPFALWIIWLDRNSIVHPEDKPTLPLLCFWLRKTMCLILTFLPHLSMTAGSSFGNYLKRRSLTFIGKPTQWLMRFQSSDFKRTLVFMFLIFLHYVLVPHAQGIL